MSTHIGGKMVKPLPKQIRVKLKDFNQARRLGGMNELSIKVRICISCGASFESIGSRICGCRDRNVASLHGYDLLH